MKSPYQKKLMDPRWQKMRLMILQRDEFQCQHCLATDKTLHVHHKYYLNCEPWEYDEGSLITLCFECHIDEGEMLDSSSKGLIQLMKMAGAESSDFMRMCEAFSAVDNDKYKGDLFSILSGVIISVDVQNAAFDKINSI